MPAPPANDSEPEIATRRAAVVEAFVHSWRGYEKFAWGKDEMKPLSNRGGQDWGGFAITMVDALDTAFMMGLKGEFDRAVDWLDANLRMDIDHRVSVFEMTIRLLGGLLSGYDLSGDARLLKLAAAAGDKLLGAFENDGSGLPSAELNMRSGQRYQQHNWAPGMILAEVGSVQLELTRLLQLTRRPPTSPLGVAAASLHTIVDGYTASHGLVSHFLSRGVKSYHLNGGCDSYYEYLLKVWLLSGQRDAGLLKAYTDAVAGINAHLVFRGNAGGINRTFVGQASGGGSLFGAAPSNFNPQMEHLACFASGMLALGALRAPSALGKDAKLAAELGETCWAMYNDSPTGLAPERIAFTKGARTNKKGYTVVEDKYALRPETIESFFYLWRLTRDPKWRERGWAIFESLQKHCRTPTAYAGLQQRGNKEDSMPSFWLAETLKYLFLLFSPDSAFDLERYVMNTEAHPLKIEVGNELRGPPF